MHCIALATVTGVGKDTRPSQHPGDLCSGALVRSCELRAETREAWPENKPPPRRVESRVERKPSPDGIAQIPESRMGLKFVQLWTLFSYTSQ